MTIPNIKFENAYVEIPIFSAELLSLRRRLLKKDGNVKYVTALSNINLEICNGQRVGLYGHNGAGKTTLLKCLAGGYHPSRGSFSIVGSVNSLIDINLGLDPEASGLQNIKLKLTMMCVDKKLFKKLIEDIIEFSGLGDAIYLPIRTYSSGMAMRLAFSISTTVKSEILLLDEWLSVGDESFAKKSSMRMSELASNSSIMVIASHSYELLTKVCNRIVRLEHGSILEDIRL